MSKWNTAINRLYFTSVLLLVIFLTACSSDKETKPKPELIYEGLTTPVVITRDNALELLVESMNAQSNSDVNIFSSPKAGTDYLPDLFSFIKSFTLHEMSSASQAISPAATENIVGTCGGTLVVQSSYTKATMIFKEFCDEVEFDTSGLTFDGIIYLELTEVEYTETITGKLSMLRVKGVVDGVQKEIVMDGTMSVKSSYLSFYTAWTINMVVNNNITGEMKKYENLVFTADADGLVMKGRIYSSGIGYIDMITETPLEVNFLGDISVGVVKIIGSENSNASLSFSDGDFTLDVDEDGDGNIEYTKSGPNSELHLTVFGA